MDRLCPQCGKTFAAKTACVNRAAKIGAPLYCGRACAGLARRLKNPPTAEERKEAKRLYDARRRVEKADEILAKKRAYFKRTYDPVAAAARRKERMPAHVAYCQRPEYKAWKAEYDRKYRAVKTYGEFADAFLMLLGIDSAVSERATRQDIYRENGTLNKAQERRRSL